MIPIKEEGEKMVLPVEEREMEEEEEAEEEDGEEEEEEEEETAAAEESGGEDDSGSEEDECDEEPEDISDDKKDKKEDTPQAVDKTKKDIPLPGQPKENKPPQSLNVNNEVVKMRKEVKRVKALIIRKLTRQIGKLRKKKGKEAEIERNQRRAARLLEEIHAMKGLSPDVVTKRALQKNLNFEQECKNPNSAISDRAIARIATHPQFKKKIEDIKAAVKAFKEERVRGGKEVGKKKMQNKAGTVVVQSPDKKGENKSGTQKDVVVEEKKTMDTEEEDSVLKGAADAALSEPEKESRKMIESNNKTVKKESPVMKMVRPSPVKSSEVKNIVRNEPKMKDAEEKYNLMPVSKEPEIKKDEESDLDSSDDEEKEYFDDSTEERFHKQSSHSEESDEDNDFFVGKVSKFKKRKQKSTETERRNDVKSHQTDEVQSKRENLESKTKSKVTSLDSVFCSSLAGSKPGGGRGAGRGRGGDRFKGQGKSRGGGDGPKGEFSKQSKFQKQEKGLERELGSQYMKSVSSEKTFPVDSRGKGRGRGGAMRKNDPRDGGVFALKPPQPALHPSWEASKKRKEQQGQILAFQGKKIKFDDDD